MIEIDSRPVVTVRATGPRYSRQDLVEAFPPKARQPSQKREKAVAIDSLQEAELTDAQRLIVAQTVAEMASDHPVLWEGRFDQLGARRGGGSYESQSDADLAMTGYIAKSLADKVSTTGELMALTEAVMGHSALAQRDKWQGRPDYRERTVTKACADVEVRPLVDWDLSGDVRNAKAFARMFRGKMLFVHKAGIWLVWQDGRWRWCELGEELEAAKEVARILVKLAADELADDPDKGSRQGCVVLQGAWGVVIGSVVEVSANFFPAPVQRALWLMKRRKHTHALTLHSLRQCAALQGHVQSEGRPVQPACSFWDAGVPLPRCPQEIDGQARCQPSAVYAWW